MSAPAISVRGLAKTFRLRRRGLDVLRPWRAKKEIHALAGIDLDVRAGELVSVLGPNGAGKTTLLKILATLVAPSAGVATVGGVDVTRDPEAARRQVGYVLSEERSFYWRLSTRDNLRFFAALQGLYGEVAQSRIDALAALLGLQGEVDRDFKDLSAGQKQRVAIARGLLADPPVLLFDEATRALDPGRRERIRRLIRERLVDQEGKAVLFATHDLDEARALSDRVVLVDEGKVACKGSYAEVEAQVLARFREEARREDEALYALFPDAAGGAA